MDKGSGKENWDSLREIVERLGYECVGIILVNEETRAILRIYIDSIGGILVKDCEIVSKTVNHFLDEHNDYVSGQFYLEVSSPGIERPLFTLDDYIRFRGRKVAVKTRMSKAEQKRFSGILREVTDDHKIVLEPETGGGTEEGNIVEIPFELISKGNLVYIKEQEKRRNS